MKRCVPLMLMLVFCLSLCACSQQSQVPDSYIQWEIEDYLDREGISQLRYEKYEIRTVHTLDSSNHTDTVDISLILDCPYGTYTAKCRQVYQYSRRDDAWTLIRPGEWGQVEETYDEDAFCTTWTGGGDYDADQVGNTYEIFIDQIDFDKRTVSCTYSFITNILDHYSVETVYYSGSDTFSFADGPLCIVEDEVTYSISFSIWDGVHVYADSGIFREK